MINKNEKPPRKLIKKTNFKSSNSVETTLAETGKIHNKKKCEGKQGHAGLVYNQLTSPTFNVLN